eukprot:6257508-Pyramimonas_sp.AAC.1
MPLRVIPFERACVCVCVIGCVGVGVARGRPEKTRTPLRMWGKECDAKISGMTKIGVGKIPRSLGHGYRVFPSIFEETQAPPGRASARSREVFVMVVGLLPSISQKTKAPRDG